MKEFLFNISPNIYVSKNYKTTYPPSKRFLSKISKIHSGYRTVFTWYMWRSIDPIDVDY